MILQISPSLHLKKKLATPCPCLNYSKNPELLQFYNKYKKNDTLNESIYINNKKGVLSIHSVECTNEEISKRVSKHVDKLAFNNCFHFPSIHAVGPVVIPQLIK